MTLQPANSKSQHSNAARGGLVPSRRDAERAHRALPSPSPDGAGGGRLADKTRAEDRGGLMTFAGLNYLAIVIAAAVSWLAGAGWYMALSKTWMAALGVSAEQMEAARREPGAWLPFVYAFVAEVVMAWVMAGLLGHIGALTLRGGVISAAFCWVGFVLTTMLVNNSFARRDWRLLLIDGGHWLLVLLLIGGIVGAMGA
jgi:hypothetical protein